MLLSASLRTQRIRVSFVSKNSVRAAGDMGRYRTIASGAPETGDAGLGQHLGELDHAGHVVAVVGDVVALEVEGLDLRLGEHVRERSSALRAHVVGREVEGLPC